MKLSEAEKLVKDAHPKWPGSAILNQVMTCVQITVSKTHLLPSDVLEESLSEGSELKEKFEQTVFWDWKEVAEKKVIDDFEVLIIPKNTALFHGTNVIDFPEKVIAWDKSYFSDLKTAAGYAFREKADVGQVLIMVTNVPITIFRMTPKNIKLLKQRYPTDFPEEMVQAYNYTSAIPRRVSHPYYDVPIQRWWCSQNIPFDGFGDRKYIGFHPEISLCKTTLNGQPLIRRLPYRYRFDIDFGGCIMLIDDLSGDLHPYPSEMITRHIYWTPDTTERENREQRLVALDLYVDQPGNKYSACTAGAYSDRIDEYETFRERSKNEYLYPLLIQRPSKMMVTSKPRIFRTPSDDIPTIPETVSEGIGYARAQFPINKVFEGSDMLQFYVDAELVQQGEVRDLVKLKYPYTSEGAAYKVRLGATMRKDGSFHVDYYTIIHRLREKYTKITLSPIDAKRSIRQAVLDNDTVKLFMNLLTDEERLPVGGGYESPYRGITFYATGDVVKVAQRAVKLINSLKLQSLRPPKTTLVFTISEVGDRSFIVQHGGMGRDIPPTVLPFTT